MIPPIPIDAERRREVAAALRAARLNRILRMDAYARTGVPAR